MKIERIDKEEIIGLICPKTGTLVLWDDEAIADLLPCTVVMAVITSLCPEECAVDDMPLAAAWKSHYGIAKASNLTLDEVVEAFPASGIALEVINSGIACGLVWDVTYIIVPEELADACFVRADREDDDVESEQGIAGFSSTVN